MITSDLLAERLAALGVRRDDTLFVHSDVSRCGRIAGENREQKLATLTGGLATSVSAGALMLPTFTYSFCRRELFDLEESPSTVGVLGEYFRRRPGVWRTAEPIFSSAVLGRLPRSWEQDLRAVEDKDCFGERSVFAYLLEADAKLLFLGVDPTVCTLICHVEQNERVNYRYFKDFRGVVATESTLAMVTARYFVRDLTSDVVNYLVPLVDSLRARRELAEERLEHGPELYVVAARAVLEAAREGLRSNPSYLLERGHPQFAREHA